MTSFYIFIILLPAAIYYQSIKAESTTLLRSISPVLDLDNSSTTAILNQTDSVFSSTTFTVSRSTVTIKPSATTTPQSTASSSSTTTIDKSITSDVDSNRISKSSSTSNRWLSTALIVTAVVAIGIGIIYYHRRRTPYRRFLQNWRSRDNDADNIVLELEQPEIMNEQRPPRISFA